MNLGIHTHTHAMVFTSGLWFCVPYLNHMKRASFQKFLSTHALEVRHLQNTSSPAPKNPSYIWQISKSKILNSYTHRRTQAYKCWGEPPRDKLQSWVINVFITHFCPLHVPVPSGIYSNRKPAFQWHTEHWLLALGSPKTMNCKALTFLFFSGHPGVTITFPVAFHTWGWEERTLPKVDSCLEFSLYAADSPVMR